MFSAFAIDWLTYCSLTRSSACCETEPMISSRCFSSISRVPPARAMRLSSERSNAEVSWATCDSGASSFVFSIRNFTISCRCRLSSDAFFSASSPSRTCCRKASFESTPSSFRNASSICGALIRRMALTVTV